MVYLCPVETNKQTNIQKDMKKALYLVVTALLCLTACTKKPACVIEGYLHEGLDVKKVYLQRLVKEGYENIDSCEVKDDQFHFNIKDTATVIRFIGYMVEGEETHQVVFVEPGNIRVDMEPGSFQVKGTPTNELYAELNGEVAGLMLRANEIDNKMRNDQTLTEDEKNTLMADLDAKVDEMNELVRRFVFDHINSPVGLFMLRRNRWRFDVPEMADLLGDRAVEYDFYGIEELREYIGHFQASSVGQPFIELSMPTPDGENFAISEIMKDNKVVMLDFWASWCGPCRREMPHVRELYDRYHSQGFDILGISVDDDADSWKAAIENLHIVWPQVSMLHGWDCEAVTRYAIIQVPTMILIDAQSGNIIARDIIGDELDAKLAELFGK